MSYWVLWLIVGLASVVAGVVALLNPFAATITAELLAGWMFILVGVLTLLSALRDQGWGGRILALLLGLLIVLFGVNLVANPLQGILTLTMLVGILMLVIGAMRVALAFTPVGSGARLFLVIAGLVSAALGGMILVSWPYSSAVILGIFLGIDLISNGLSMIFLALDRRAPDDA